MRLNFDDSPPYQIISDDEFRKTYFDALENCVLDIRRKKKVYDIYLGKWPQNHIGQLYTIFWSLILPFSPSTLASIYTSWLISFSHILSFSALEGHIKTKRPQMIKRHRRSNIRTVLCSLSYEPLSNTSADCQANMCYRT